MRQRTYKKETRNVTLQDKTITVTHLTPVLSTEERAKQKQEIERKLYEVYSKYENKDRNAA